MEIASLSPADLAPIATAPARPGSRLGLCLLYGADGFELGHWDGEGWWTEDLDRELQPERWLLLRSSP